MSDHKVIISRSIIKDNAGNYDVCIIVADGLCANRITYHPQPGPTDESRNCVSNIRPGGFSFNIAIDKIAYLIQESFKRKLSGVNLKDESGLLGNR